MVVLVCACSLFGVILIPLLNKENKFHGLYKYIYALMIALGTSALFCDAILHLIPEVDKFCSRACDSYICTFCKLHMFTTWSQNVRPISQLKIYFGALRISWKRQDGQTDFFTPCACTWANDKGSLNC